MTSFAQQSLSIGDGSTQGLSSTTLTITMDATSDVQGYVLAIAYDESLATASDLSASGAAADAELIVPEILSGGVTLGIVMDAVEPYGGQSIAAGTGTTIAALTMAPTGVVSEDTDVAVDFSDGTLNSPPLDNIIVQGGLSIGVDEGLGLNGGTLTLLEPPPATMYAEDSSAPADGFDTTGDARILLDNSLGGVQGFVTAMTHDPAAITLVSISLGADALTAGTEFEISNQYENGGTLGAVVDFSPPFDGQTIPQGNGVHLASYTYFCVNSNIYTDGAPGTPPPAETSPLTLVNGTLGSPALDNVIVVAGLSVTATRVDGTFTCTPVGVPAEDTTLWMETHFDEDAGNYAYHGQTGDLCFFYKDDDDYIQGFTFTICYDCNLTIHEDSWEFNGSILDQVGVEYLAVQVDDDPDDGDGCELIVALLMD
ncbi:MAG: hypothetical protein VX764_04485, partial [Planctomycetota bacterium]|nr:hypothetical protein [Planctomycetota bacterium]